MYQVLIEKRARKSLLKIAKQDQKKIIDAIQALKENQHPAGSKKLVGRDAWRIRIGNYRVIYEIYDEKLIVDVIDLGHRKDIYRNN